MLGTTALPDLPRGSGIILALYASDPSYSFEIQRAPDVSGAPGTFATIVYPIDGTTRLYYDALPIDGLTYWYRYRHVGLGDTPSAFVGPVSSTPKLFPANVDRPDAVLPTVQVSSVESGTLGSVTITIVDPQFRVSSVEAQTVVAGGAPSAWNALTISGGVYSQTVSVTTGLFSSVAYRVNAYDATGVLRIIQADTYTFGSSAGPSLDVVATPGSSTYSISYTGTGVLLSVNGGSFSAAPASPIVVSRPSAGSAPSEYTFKVVIGSLTTSDSVTIPAIDQDTVTPDLVVTPGTVAASTIDYTVTASNPRGSPAPTITATIVGTSMVIGGTTFGTGSTVSISSGTVVTVNRAAFGTVTQPAVTFKATISGGGAETIQRTVQNQVKTSFGPTLDVVTTPGSTSYSIAYTSTGTLQLSIDGGAYSSPAASPIVVTRTSSDHTYVFQATLDGQTNTVTVLIPALAGGGGPSFASIAVAVHSTALDQVEIQFTTSGAPGGATYIGFLWEQTAISNPKVGTTQQKAGSSSPIVFDVQNDLDPAGTRTKRYTGYVQMISGASVVATSSLDDQTFPSNT